ncbi:hypothetical protein B0T19DRAFT_480791 [Cercophora scortea]|uniref:RRM domain-containing protein n=1 Tax=Cercophora scortea TaxID=314031 RepID=A0AAE0MKV6_9PEZI|nr:hypothetical protein B0T19DRAFT_480791 [Cercophora scortea]
MSKSSLSKKRERAPEDDVPAGEVQDAKVLKKNKTDATGKAKVTKEEPLESVTASADEEAVKPKKEKKDKKEKKERTEKKEKADKPVKVEEEETTAAKPKKEKKDKKGKKEKKSAAKDEVVAEVKKEEEEETVKPKKEKKDKKDKSEKKEKKDKKSKKSKDDADTPATADVEMTDAAAPAQEETKKSKKDKKKSKKDAPATDDAHQAPTTQDEEAAAAATEADAAAASSKNSRFICFIGNLPFTATAESIKAHFASVHPISVRLLTERDNPSKSRGIAFVEFGRFDHMKTCLEKFHHTEFDDKLSPARKINVELTAGGGGKTKQREEKIKEKNRKLNEERINRVHNQAAAKLAKDGKEEAPKEVSVEDIKMQEQRDEQDIHPSRRAIVPFNAENAKNAGSFDDEYDNQDKGGYGNKRSFGGGRGGRGGRGRGGRGGRGGGGRGRR